MLLFEMTKRKGDNGLLRADDLKKESQLVLASSVYVILLAAMQFRSLGGRCRLPN
jgi:hypothetical protein